MSCLNLNLTLDRVNVIYHYQFMYIILSNVQDMLK